MWQLGSPNNPKRKLLLGIGLLGTTSNAGASSNAGITVTQSMSGRSVKESSLVSDTLVSLASGGQKTVYASGSSVVNAVQIGLNIAGSKVSKSVFVHQVVIAPAVIGARTSSNSFTDAMTVVGSYLGYKLGSGNVAATVTVQSSASGTKYVNSTAYDVVLTYGQVLGVKPVSGGSTDTVSIFGNGFTGSKQVAGNALSNVEVQVNLSWHKQSYGELLSLNLINQSGLGYKVNKASFNKFIIVNAYGEGEAYFKVNVACLHSRYYIVTALVPKYLVHTALFPVTISATILTTKCATLAVTHSSNIGKQITLTSRILACQKECY